MKNASQSLLHQRTQSQKILCAVGADGKNGAEFDAILIYCRTSNQINRPHRIFARLREIAAKDAHLHAERIRAFFGFTAVPLSNQSCAVPQAL